MAENGTLHAPKVDETLKELGRHGSFELPVETYTDNCVIFHSLYNHWHKEMEIICIEKGCGLAKLNRETIRLKQGDILMVNSGSHSRHKIRPSELSVLQKYCI